LCKIVNDPKPYPWTPTAGVKRFKEWVVAWRASPSLLAMVDDLGLGTDLDNYIHADYFPSATNRSAEIQLQIHRPWQKQGAVTPDELTLELFAQLITNPLCEKFGGPCAHPKCCKYFVKRTSDQRFCGTKCNNAYTAGKATEKRNKRNRRLKNNFAKIARREYKQLLQRPSGSWQEWVAKRATQLMRKNPYTRSLDAMTRNFVSYNLIPKHRKKGGVGRFVG
jgi:hypothetical protein